MSTKNIRTQAVAVAGHVRKNSEGWMLKTVSTRLDNVMKERLKQLDLSLGQFAILMTLTEHGQLIQSEIGKKIAMPGYATTRNIDVLEERGLLARHTDAHSRRSNCIRLTAKGRKLAPKLFPIVGEVNRELLAPLSQKEANQLNCILQKLVGG